ncbi:hypothetical protein BRADI_5g22902v3 [Brachypodium distachyon]|uniref:Uncharacterized protein n=1 Tax=Brachypodium distachyon TaxID=15368 RepID=A0A2K2CIP8_BRADI|nr:hypothetical protein BRADI_5g22902v3 [Brachypodium distachyon]
MIPFPPAGRAKLLLRPCPCHVASRPSGTIKTVSYPHTPMARAALVAWPHIASNARNGLLLPFLNRGSPRRRSFMPSALAGLVTHRYHCLYGSNVRRSPVSTEIICRRTSVSKSEDDCGWVTLHRC